MNAPPVPAVDRFGSYPFPFRLTSYGIGTFPFSLFPFPLYSAAMPYIEIASIFLIVAVAWLWLDSLKAREAAVRAAREVCAVEGLQFLDDTVAIAGLKLARDDDGNLTLQRAYHFEYSDTGDNRLKGSVVMRGHRVALLNVGLRLAPAVRTLH